MPEKPVCADPSSHDPDNFDGVSYQLFMRALRRYAKAEMRLGR